MNTLSLAMIVAVTATAASAHADDVMNDLEIAHAAYTADAIDIRYGHLALAISENDAVRSFAETMIRDHNAVNAAAGELLAELNVSPQDNALSRSLLEGAASKRAELMSLTGREFDCAYALNELGYHQVVNATVADSFIPVVTVAPLRTLLTDALVTFRVHEAHAGRMVTALECAS
ncbi:DUF4142 domain-containing protein [uncultured Maricaulis sp.]|uniref:DUF4142 domain-containing protein n=1 Tax=uncultured Maricaulis sp. TaxID=174710 RepID=UPI0030D7E730|tara:strand:- start:2321 stop:2848 length:528 start_codon:yes stop_codon:yes gene_type:complete